MASPNIFFKLGSVAAWYHQRFNIRLQQGGIFASYIPINNIDAEIAQGLNIGEIIQITEAEYYSIGPTGPGIEINPNTITLANFLVGCPIDQAVFFTWVGGTWYKIWWEDIKSCITLTATLILQGSFKVGKVGYPQKGDNVWQDNNFKDKSMRMKVNGITMYTEDEWQNGDSPTMSNIDYINFDPIAGQFTRPSGFQAGEIIEYWDQKSDPTRPVTLPT